MSEMRAPRRSGMRRGEFSAQSQRAKKFRLVRRALAKIGYQVRPIRTISRPIDDRCVWCRPRPMETFYYLSIERKRVSTELSGRTTPLAR